jgi:excisionase family DNA binding protein
MELDAIVKVMEAGMRRTHDPAVYITVSELADELGVHRNTIHYWISRGKLEARRIGLARRSPLLITRMEAARVKHELEQPV